jgi:hypothetical protein
VFKPRPKIFDDRAADTPEKPFTYQVGKRTPVVETKPKDIQPVVKQLDFDEAANPFETHTKVQLDFDDKFDDKSVGRNGVVTDLRQLSLVGHGENDAPPQQQPRTPVKSQQLQTSIYEDLENTPKAYPYSAMKRLLAATPGSITRPIVSPNNNQHLGSTSSFLPIQPIRSTALSRDSAPETSAQITKLQTQVRDMKRFFKIQLRAELARHHRAATRIQAWYRGCCVRVMPDVKNLRANKNHPKPNIIAVLQKRIDWLEAELDKERQARRLLDNRLSTLQNIVSIAVVCII